MRLLLLLFALTSLQLNAQSTNFINRLSVRAEYYGETIMHPGMAVGVECAVFKNSWFLFHSDIDFGFYIHQWNNNALFLKNTWGLRFTSRPGLFADIGLGAGYLHTFPAGDVYIPDGNGGVIKKNTKGYPCFMPNAALLWGWDFNKKIKFPLSVYIGLEAFIQMPFNHNILPHAVFKIGGIYKIKK